MSAVYLFLLLSVFQKRHTKRQIQVNRTVMGILNMSVVQGENNRISTMARPLKTCYCCSKANDLLDKMFFLFSAQLINMCDFNCGIFFYFQLQIRTKVSVNLNSTRTGL